MHKAPTSAGSGEVISRQSYPQIHIFFWERKFYIQLNYQNTLNWQEIVEIVVLLLNTKLTITCKIENQIKICFDLRTHIIRPLKPYKFYFNWTSHVGGIKWTLNQESFDEIKNLHNVPTGWRICIHRTRWGLHMYQ